MSGRVPRCASETSLLFETPVLGFRLHVWAYYHAILVTALATFHIETPVLASGSPREPGPGTAVKVQRESGAPEKLYSKHDVVTKSALD